MLILNRLAKISKYSKGRGAVDIYLKASQVFCLEVLCSIQLLPIEAARFQNHRHAVFRNVAIILYIVDNYFSKCNSLHLWNMYRLFCTETGYKTVVTVLANKSSINLACFSGSEKRFILFTCISEFLLMCKIDNTLEHSIYMHKWLFTQKWIVKLMFLGHKKGEFFFLRDEESGILTQYSPY